MAKLAAEKDYAAAKWQWQRQGLHACRHGIFFTLPRGSACPCMKNTTSSAHFASAVWMACLDFDDQILSVTAFEYNSFQRLGLLRAQMRRLGW
eukprot:5141515-Karenia_brevis.AAC.1